MARLEEGVLESTLELKLPHMDLYVIYIAQLKPKVALWSFYIRVLLGATRLDAAIPTYELVQRTTAFNR
jgi:hypothetical protein